MARARVAPVLTKFVDGLHPDGPKQADEKETMRSELRALLAVARAAKEAADDYDEEPYGLHRALARLSRVSGSRGGRRA